MSYPPLTFVKLPACSASPLRDGSPLLTRSRDAALPSSPLRSARETAASSPARSATHPRPTHGATSTSAGEKRRSFWSDLFVNSDSSQDNEDEDEDSDGDVDSGHPLRSSLSLLSGHTTQKRKRAALEQPSQSSRVIASAAPFLTTKRRKLVDTAEDGDDDDDNRLNLGITEPKYHAWPRVDKGGVVILDDDEEEDAFVLQVVEPRHTPPPSPLSERNSNKEGGSGSPWLRRKRDAVAVATVKPTALHPQPAAANHHISDDADDMEKEESESDKENRSALADDHRRSQKANQKPQPSVKRVEETVKKPSCAPLANQPERREIEAEERAMDLEGGDDGITLEAERPEGPSSTAGAQPPHLKFLSPFTEEEVKKWSKARLQAWKQRHRNANSYYYRFTDPTVAQSERKLSREEHQAFMRRYEEFQRNGWRVGTSWGLFSMALPSRVGYQCANHYRKLLKEGKLNDNSFKLDPKGEVKLVEGADTRGHESALANPAEQCGIENALSDVWKTKEVKAIERCVDKWIGEYHEGASKALSFPDDEDDEACKNDDDNETGELQASGHRKFKPKSKPGPSTKRGRPQPTVASFIAACDEAAPRETIVLDTDEDAFEADQRGAAHAKKRNAATEDGEDETERRGHSNESEADGSIDDPVEENMFVYAAQDEDDAGVTTTTTISAYSFKRPQSNVWKNFIVGDASEPLYGHRKARAPAGRGRALKGKQLDLSHFIPGVKPAPAVVEAEDNNKSLIDKTVIPRPIPRSWAKAVQPFDYEAARGQKAIPGSRYVETTIEELELEKLGSFEAILMDPPWDLSPRASASNKAPQSHQLPKRGKNGERLISPEELGKWPVTDKLIPKGFLFIWTEKELIPRVLTMAQKWGFHYVENFAWVKFDVNNKIHTEDYAYFRKSKLTLLMLRKPGDIELRHQRNPDVKFDFVRKGRERLPFVFDIIETLLPTAKYNPKTGKGKMLQLWCLPQERRSGWTSVHLADESARDDESPVELEYVESPSSEE